MATDGSAARGIARRFRNVLDRITVAGAADRPVFAGGCPRSGTTLVRTMLHSHPDLALPRETRFVLEAFARRIDFGDLGDRANRSKLIDWLLGERSTQFSRLGLEPDDARRRMADAPPTLGSVLGTAFAMFAEAQGAARWGDKRPAYIQKIPMVRALFPDLQFVNVVRDPRAVVASMKKLGWFESQYDGTAAGPTFRWVQAIKAGRLAATDLRPDQFFEVRYEDLVADPEPILRRVCAFAGLDVEHIAAMLAFHERADEIPDKQRQKFHPNIARPVTTATTSSWSDVLDQGEVALIERVAAPQMERYGYEPSLPGATVPGELERRWAEIRHKNRRTPVWPRAHSPKYPHPVAARLTTGQRRRAKLVRMGRF